MIITVVLIVSICLIGLRKCDTHEDPFEKRYTTTINGIFVLLIFLSHSVQYLPKGNDVLSILYLKFKSLHGQLVVTTFLTFSGFGVMNNIITKGSQYIKGFIKNRVVKTLLHFNIAVIVYLVVQGLLYNRFFSIWEVLGALIGWRSVGNSAWYIMSIVLLYLFSWIAYKIARKNQVFIPLIVILLSLLYIAFIMFIHAPSRYISTILCYPFGMYVALFKPYLINKCRQRTTIWFVGLIILFLFTAILRNNPIVMNIHSVFFVALLMSCMVFFKVESSCLYYLGKNAFGIYILQKLPMIMLCQYINNIFIFVPACFTITIILSMGYNKFLSVVDKKIG